MVLTNISFLPLQAAQVISNSGHDDMIHDAVLDYYGRKLATCSSDRTIKIFEIDGESQRLIETLKGYDGHAWYGLTVVYLCVEGKYTHHCV
ncbi:Protein transport protein sec13 [Claviceps pusilla]|uniref:Protein transport protein SEC13 n=1 Tax=Claviceps pusilla TaxID=123648 RepID=A0A9P7T2E9_9HYPO|nr:Protein transport protein sec13 [Claviceps pusilla]